MLDWGAGVWLEAGAEAPEEEAGGALPAALEDEEPDELEPDEPEPPADSPAAAKVGVPVQAGWPLGARLAGFPSYSIMSPG